MNSAQQNILNFLKSNPSVFPAAELQRMQFRNRNNTTASPKAISRRLQELAEDGTIKVEYRGKNAFYSYNPASEPPERSYVPVILPDGTRAVREVGGNLPPPFVSPAPRSEECVVVGLESVKDEYGMCTGELREVWG